MGIDDKRFEWKVWPPDLQSKLQLIQLFSDKLKMKTRITSSQWNAYSFHRSNKAYDDDFITGIFHKGRLNSVEDYNISGNTAIPDNIESSHTYTT